MLFNLFIASFLVASFESRETRAFCQSSLTSLHLGLETSDDQSFISKWEESFHQTAVSSFSVPIDLDSFISDMSYLLALLSKNEVEFFFEELQKKSSAFLNKNFGRHFIDWLRKLDEKEKKLLKGIMAGKSFKSRNSKASQIRFKLEQYLPRDFSGQIKLFRKFINEYSLMRGTSKSIEEVIDTEGRVLIEQLRKRKLIHWNRKEGEEIWVDDLVPLESLQNEQLPLLFAITPNSKTKKMDLFVAIDPESRDFEKDQLNSSLESQINLYTVHSHVARGQNVIYSGILWVNLKGDATYASLESGHYMLPRIKAIETAVKAELSIPKAQNVLETLAERDRLQLAKLLIEDFGLRFLDFDRLSDRFFVRQNEWLSLFPRYSDR
ncbi:MAG: hypothetical protein ACO3LE_05810 [Bdellovibrionota bacterium]